MSENEQPLSSSSVQLETQSTSKGKNKPFRKGTGAAKRDQEKHRIRSNEKFDKQLLEKHANIRSEGVEAMFGDVLITAVKPSIQKRINIAFVDDIVRGVCQALLTECKVNIDDQDVETLLRVTQYQIQSKVWFSRSHGPFDYNLAFGEIAKTTKMVFPNSIFPISFYIEQIGTVSVSDQTIYPTIDSGAHDLLEKSNNMVIELPENNTLSQARVWLEIVNAAFLVESGVLVHTPEGYILSQAYVDNPTNFVTLGAMRMHYRPLIPRGFNELCNQYQILLSKIDRRVNNAINPVDFDKAKGSSAQLVNSRLLASGILYATSNRFLDHDTLAMGALLRLGFGLIDDNDADMDDFRCVEATIEPRGSLMRFCSQISKRLRFK